MWSTSQVFGINIPVGASAAEYSSSSSGLEKKQLKTVFLASLFIVHLGV
jgi:hypothetical protein